MTGSPSGPSALVHAPQDEAWKRIKSLVLDSVASRHSKRAYEQALDAFERWCAQTGGPGGHTRPATAPGPPSRAPAPTPARGPAPPVPDAPTALPNR